jgi:hypothetical protein
MRMIQAISEDEMIAIFLQTEVYSSRFEERLEALARQPGVDLALLRAPDWHAAEENAQRDCCSARIAAMDRTGTTLLVFLPM